MGWRGEGPGAGLHPLGQLGGRELSLSGLPEPRAPVQGQMCCHRCLLSRGWAVLVEGPGELDCRPVYR